jgi:hypothetical protein
MTIRDELAEQYPEALFADGLEDAILGAAHVFDRDGQRDAIAYDYDACLDVFVRDGMTLDDAEEWMSFNVLGAYVGDGTPVFVRVAARLDWAKLTEHHSAAIDLLDEARKDLAAAVARAEAAERMVETQQILLSFDATTGTEQRLRAELAALRAEKIAAGVPDDALRGASAPGDGRMEAPYPIRYHMQTDPNLS